MTMMENPSVLVGIPWSGDKKPPEGADCVTLMLYAQKILWGRQIVLDMDISWNESNHKARSHDIGKYIGGIADRIREPEEGAIGIVEAFGYSHLVTFIDEYRVLHIVLGSDSRISRCSPALKRRAQSIWRPKGGI